MQFKSRCELRGESTLWNAACYQRYEALTCWLPQKTTLFSSRLCDATNTILLTSCFLSMEQIRIYLSRFPSQNIPVHVDIVCSCVRAAAEEAICLVAIRETLVERVCYFTPRRTCIQVEVALQVIMCSTFELNCYVNSGCLPIQLLVL